MGIGTSPLTKNTHPITERNDPFTDLGLPIRKICTSRSGITGKIVTGDLIIKSVTGSVGDLLSSSDVSSMFVKTGESHLLLHLYLGQYCLYTIVNVGESESLRIISLLIHNNFN